MAMQECILMLRVEAQKSIYTVSKSRKIRVFPDDKVPKKMIFSQSRVYMAMQG